jgi:hypothetical protein
VRSFPFTVVVVSLLLVRTVVTADSKQDGKLCVEGMSCVAAALASNLPVVPSDQARTFTWVDAADRQIVLGVLPSEGRYATLEAAAAIRLRLSSTDPARWPLATALTVRGEGHEWQVPLSARQSKAGVELRLAPGVYELIAESSRHRRLSRQVTVATEAVVALELQALPQLSGRVIAKTTNEPVAGAAVSLPGGEVIAISDGGGRFAFDANPDEWPESITIAAGGMGTRTVPVPRARAAADLLDVALSDGATIRVTIEREPAIKTVRIELYKRRYDVPEATPVATKSIGPEDTAVTFEQVEAGTYVVIASGQEPSQRHGTKLTVASGEKQITILIVPSRLSIRTEMGGTPLPGAQIRLSNGDGLWREEFHADSEGKLELSVWQLGRLAALVSAEGILTVPHREERSFEDQSEAEWVIRVSTREVRGRVLDAGSGKPVANANLALRVEGRYTALTKADRDGRFVFTAAVPGEHTVSAAADGYQHDSVDYVFAESEQKHDVTLRLVPAASVRIVALDPAGRPIANAAVLDFTGYMLTGERFTDERGEVFIPMGTDDTRDVYVIPRDGSFGIGTAGGKNETAIMIPTAQSTIVVTSMSTEQQPIPGVWVVLRFNGIPVPFEVQQMLARQQGAAPVSGADGRIVLRQMPLGVYEMWPVGSPGEARAAMSGLGPDSPVKIVARPGLNEAVLEFAPSAR